MEKEVTGKFKFDKDTKRTHRFQIIVDGSGVVGTIYIPKESDRMPERIVLEYEGK